MDFIFHPFKLSTVFFLPTGSFGLFLISFVQVAAQFPPCFRGKEGTGKSGSHGGGKSSWNGMAAFGICPPFLFFPPFYHKQQFPPCVSAPPFFMSFPHT